MLSKGQLSNDLTRGDKTALFFTATTGDKMHTLLLKLHVCLRIGGVGGVGAWKVALDDSVQNRTSTCCLVSHNCLKLYS